MTKKRHTAAGFTLLEMLVVLILTGMITTLLLQGLHQIYRLQSHFGAEMFNTRQGAMHIAWYRQTINGLIPDYPGGKREFRGERRQLEGLTNAPLNSPESSLVPFRWHLRFDPRRGETLLQYGTGEEGATILSWQGDSGEFVYLDAKGDPHDTWPPAIGQWPQLPSAVHLQTGKPEQDKIIVAAPLGPVYRLLPRKSLEFL